MVSIDDMPELFASFDSEYRNDIGLVLNNLVDSSRDVDLYLEALVKVGHTHGAAPKKC